MGMPWQLEEGLKRFRKLKLRPRPIAELLPSINIAALRIPTDDRIYTLPNAAFSFPIPNLATIRLSRDGIEFNYRPLHRGQLGRRQVLQIKPLRVGYGTRYLFQCDCGRGAYKLFFHNTVAACKTCHRVRYSSQSITPRNRPVLQASRLQNLLENAQLYQRTKERLTKKL